MEDTTLFGRHAVALMERLYLLAGATCNAVGDMSLIEYTMLLCASETDTGTPVHMLETRFDCFKNPQHFMTLLEDKELAVRVRDPTDRRGRSLRVTDKGTARIQLVDEAIAVALIANNIHLAQDEFEHFLRMLHASARAEGSFKGDTLFPGMALVGLCRYHRFYAQVASVLGVTPLLLAMLCVLDSAGSTDAAYVAECVGITSDVASFQLHHLVARGLAAGEDMFAVTEEGAKRMEVAQHALSERLEPGLARLGEAMAEQMRNCVATALYLLR